MPTPPRQLKPGEVVIGFMSLTGELIGDWAEPQVGHEELSYRVSSLRTRLANGQAVGVTLAKSKEGDIRVYGSGYFPFPSGASASTALRELARRLVS